MVFREKSALSNLLFRVKIAVSNLLFREKRDIIKENR